MHLVRLSQPLVEALQQLDAMGGEASVCDMTMSAPVYANFASLRYWDLIDPVYRTDGTRVRGRWRISPRGREFLDGATPIRIGLWREGGRRIAWQLEAPLQFVHEVVRPLTHPAPVSPVWN